MEELLESYQQHGCNMNVKVHFLHSHLDYFHENLDDFTGKQGERFDQEKWWRREIMESGMFIWWPNTVGCWRDCTEEHQKRPQKRKFQKDCTLDYSLYRKSNFLFSLCCCELWRQLFVFWLSEKYTMIFHIFVIVRKCNVIQTFIWTQRNKPV